MNLDGDSFLVMLVHTVVAKSGNWHKSNQGCSKHKKNAEDRSTSAPIDLTEPQGGDQTKDEEGQDEAVLYTVFCQTGIAKISGAENSWRCWPRVDEVNRVLVDEGVVKCTFG